MFKLFVSVSFGGDFGFWEFLAYVIDSIDNATIATRVTLLCVMGLLVGVFLESFEINSLVI